MCTESRDCNSEMMFDRISDQCGWYRREDAVIGREGQGCNVRYRSDIDDWLYTIDDASGVADDRKMTARLSKQKHTGRCTVW